MEWPETGRCLALMAKLKNWTDQWLSDSISYQGLREGGSGGTSLPGPGRVQVSALSFGIAP